MLDVINKYLWIIAISMIVYTSIYYCIKLKFVHINIKQLIKSIFLNIEKKDRQNFFGGMFLSLGSKVGVGSLSGVALSIYIGGPGTIFWIWIFTFLISILSYLEGYLASKYQGENITGPFFYMEKILKNKKIIYFYAVVLLISYSIGFLGIQENTMVVITNEITGVNKFIISLIFALISLLIFIRGSKFINKVINVIVPVMTIIFLMLGIDLVRTNINEIHMFFKIILTDALSFKSSLTGVGSGILIGLQRSIFASEIGLGTNALSTTITSNSYKRQGYLQVLGTYIINFIIITITALFIILSPYNNTFSSNINGIELTNFAFFYHYNYIGEYILFIIIIFFSVSTIIGGYYYGEKCLKYILKKPSNKILLIFKISVSFSLFIFGILSSSLVWKLIDLTTSILIIINTLVIYKFKNILKDIKK